MLAHQYSWTLALAQTDLNCVLPSTRGSLKRHAVNQMLLLQNRKSSFTVIRRFPAGKKLSGESRCKTTP